jgi:hypothetical protein
MVWSTVRHPAGSDLRIDLADALSAVSGCRGLQGAALRTVWVQNSKCLRLQAERSASLYASSYRANLMYDDSGPAERQSLHVFDEWAGTRQQVPHRRVLLVCKEGTR